MPAIDPVAADVGKRIRAARLWLGLSQIEFARRVGVQTAATVSDWERGVRFPQPGPRAKVMRIVAKAEADQVEKANGVAG
jgi:DNA-binding transcriptional regulator YiaG